MPECGQQAPRSGSIVGYKGSAEHPYVLVASSFGQWIEAGFRWQLECYRDWNTTASKGISMRIEPADHAKGCSRAFKNYPPQPSR